jgi:hypothetical protein
MHGLQFAAHPPTRTNELSVVPTWEPHIAGYNSIVQAGAEDFRIYYDVIGPGGWRVMCVAVSSNGRTNWTKPSLRLNRFNGSTANNIGLGGTNTSTVSPGAVFLDTNPAVKPQHRFKANALLGGVTKPGCVGITCHLKRGVYVFGSADGYKFEVISGPHVPFSDSQAVIFFEPVLSKYAVYFRTHAARPDNALCHAGSRAGRSVGRLVVADLSAASWGDGDHEEAVNTTVFNVDARDSPCEDVYTNAAVRIADAVFLFPMMYEHCSTNTSAADRFGRAWAAAGRQQRSVAGLVIGDQ